MPQSIRSGSTFDSLVPALTDSADIVKALKDYHYGVISHPSTQGQENALTTGIVGIFNTKANLAGPTFTGTVVLPSTTSIGNVSATELGYLDGVTSSIQTQINGVGKVLLQTTTSTSGASTITFSSISQAYKTLEVVYTVGTASTSATTMSIRFSGDTATNYAYAFQTQSATASTNTSAPVYSNGFDQVYVLVPLNHRENTAVGSFKIDNYTSTSGSKIGSYSGYVNYVADEIVNGTFAWKNRTTAVTSITLTFNGTLTGQIVTAKLYGIN